VSFEAAMGRHDASFNDLNRNSTEVQQFWLDGFLTSSVTTQDLHAYTGPTCLHRTYVSTQDLGTHTGPRCPHRT